LSLGENPKGSNSALDALINENHLETEEERAQTSRIAKK
jgi:magnesium-transporting ATPase (P-type)